MNPVHPKSFFVSLVAFCSPSTRSDARRWFRAASWRWLLLVLALPILRAHGPLHEEIVRLTAELERHPENPVRLARRGELLQLHGLPAEALADFEHLARLVPRDVTNDFRLGQAQLELGATNEAVLRLTRFAAARPRSTPGHLALAQALGRAGQFREAAGQFGLVIELNAEPSPDWFLEQSRALRAAGASIDEQLQYLDAGIARLGPLPALQLTAVDMEIQRGATDAALARLDALAARAERKERWLARRGNVLLGAGRTNEARAEFIAARNALDALPDKLRRAWTASELRQQLEAKLAALPSGAEAPHSKSP